ncbi:thiamine-phosphate kinase [Anaerobacillus alkalilacustris]|uniref:Thiamine-monophosphate kinase n=1 Tax=Anaerobacillus alkalilacustris TaxID=393763 RepID=A0A1S2LH03_9BACI|nr:thiamine-phosphate kinase [Anaerobacillus alkalilacustris]OIJ11363.1 thiamine-phosphate kinase [Anaerobacillus alkalilacustris]
MLRDEFDFITKIKPKIAHQSSLKKGIGDDAAVFEGNSMFDELICMDTMVEGVHFTKETMAPFMIGYKALAVNISDIAAMGGVPTYYLVSIAIPNDWDEKELKEIYEGMKSLGDKYSVDLIGGDTVSSKQGLIITVTVCGKIEKESSLYRSNASPGDFVFLIGEVGGSAAGLELLLKHGLHYPFSNQEKKLIEAHQYPTPQIEAGQLLASSKQRISLNDISDGLASEANEIAEASNVTLNIDYDKIPRNSFIEPYSEEKQKQWILFGGEDYQLIGTIPKAFYSEINQTFNQNGIKFTIIGEVSSGDAEVYLINNYAKQILPKKGFNHFNKGE